MSHNRSCQLIQVIAEQWNSTSAILQRFQRANSEADWMPYGKAIDVTLGRSGLAWGLGLHDLVAIANKPQKSEGDGCSPAGVFEVTELFGYAENSSSLAKGLKMPYRAATPDLKCIDDPASRYYNQMVELSRIRETDWHSYEDMLRKDSRYELGAVLAHNTQPVLAGAGSCIFLHVWEAPGAPTAGCTAASMSDVLEICCWLDASKFPVLVQLPTEECNCLNHWVVDTWSD